MCWVLNITKFKNGMIVVMDEDGKQIPHLQGPVDQALPKIINHMVSTEHMGLVLKEKNVLSKILTLAPIKDYDYKDGPLLFEGEEDEDVFGAWQCDCGTGGEGGNFCPTCGRNLDTLEVD